MRRRSSVNLLIKLLGHTNIHRYPPEHLHCVYRTYTRRRYIGAMVAGTSSPALEKQYSKGLEPMESGLKTLAVALVL